MKANKNRQIMDNMLVFHDGPHATYAALIYREDGIEWAKEGAKFVQYGVSALVKGSAIHAHMIKDREKQAFFVTLVRAAKTLNHAIIKLCEDETNRLHEKSKKKRKRR